MLNFGLRFLMKKKNCKNSITEKFYNVSSAFFSTKLNLCQLSFKLISGLREIKFFITTLTFKITLQNVLKSMKKNEMSQILFR